MCQRLKDTEAAFGAAGVVRSRSELRRVVGRGRATNRAAVNAIVPRGTIGMTSAGRGLVYTFGRSTRWLATVPIRLLFC